MSVPKSVTRVYKNGDIKYTSNVDAVQYTMKELCRGALRDCGKFLKKTFTNEFYGHLNKHSGRGGSNAGYWARARETDLQFGLGKQKSKGFWARFYETGSKKTPAYYNLRASVYDNVGKLQQIQSQYLSALSDENPSLAGLSEGDYEDD